MLIMKMKRHRKELLLANIGRLATIQYWMQRTLFPMCGSDLPMDTFKFLSV